MSVHGRLSARVRDAVIPILDPATGQVRSGRCVEVVDATLAHHAGVFSVPEFTRIGNRIVANLDPPTPDDAHERRYLHLSRLANGSLVGKFACGPAQAVALTAAIAALSAPRPGVGIDADGVEHAIPDQRTPAQRDLDALIDAATHNCTGHPDHPGHPRPRRRRARPAARGHGGHRRDQRRGRRARTTATTGHRGGRQRRR